METFEEFTRRQDELQLVSDNKTFAENLLISYGFDRGSREFVGFFNCVFLLCDGRLLDDALGASGFTRDDAVIWAKEDNRVDLVLKRAAARGAFSDSERWQRADKTEAYKLTLMRRHKEAQTWFSTKSNSVATTGESLDTLFGGLE